MAKKLTQTALEKKITGLTWIADESCPGLRARLSMNKGSRRDCRSPRQGGQRIAPDCRQA